MRPSFSLGIEEEYQAIDPITRDLRSHIETEMLAQGKLRLEERVKAEMHKSVIEVGTRVCRNIAEAREDIYDLRREMVKLAREHNLGARSRRHPSLRRLADAGNLPRPALSPGRQRSATRRPAPTSSSASTYTSASKTARPPSAS